MTLGRFPLPLSEPTPEFWWLLYKQADFRAWRTMPILPPGHTVHSNKIAAVETWPSPSYQELTTYVLRPTYVPHTQPIYILYKLEELIKLLVVFGNSAVLFFFINNIRSRFKSLAINDLFFLRCESSLPYS